MPVIALVVSGIDLGAMSIEIGGVGVIAETWDTMPLDLVGVAFPFLIGIFIMRFRHAAYGLYVPAWVLAVALAGFLVILPMAGLMNALYDLLCVAVIFPIIVLYGSLQSLTHWPVLVSISTKLSYPLYIMHLPLLAILDPLTVNYGFGGISF